MIEKFLKDNLVGISIIQVLQLSLAAVKFENNSLEVEVANLNKVIQEYQLQVTTLDQNNIQLKKVVEENNQRVQLAAQAQESLKAQGKLQQAQADAQAKTYEEKIKALMAKKQEGTVCEQVFGLLDSLD